MTDERSPAPGEFLLYETEDGRTRVECRFVEDSLWLTQALMAELFQVKVPTINEHLKTLYADSEIQPEATIRKFLIVRQEGSRRVSRNIDHYNLDAILAVGYRVRSTRGTQFRRWATERLAKNYLQEPEIGELNRIVTMWLDFAEDQARRRKEVFLKDWVEKLDAFLKFNERDVLDGAGRVSKKQADAHAESQYEQFTASCSR